MKVVLDANVLVAAFAASGLCSDLVEICFSNHQVILSRAILRETNHHLVHKAGVPQSIAKNIEDYLTSVCQIAVPLPVPDDACRDKTDLMILGTAVAGNADVIITGDLDLLVLRQFKSIKILSPRMFWDLETKRGER